MRKIWNGIAFCLAICLVLVVSSSAYATTDIGKLSLDTAVNNALTNSAESVQMANTVSKLEEVKKQLDYKAKRDLKGVEIKRLDQYAYYQYVVAPAKAANSLDSAYLSQKQLALITRITTATSYYNVAACGLREKSAYNSLLKAQRSHEDAKALFEQGQASKMEVMNADIQLENARMFLLAARNNTLQAKRELCLKMGIAADTAFSIDSQLAYRPLNITDDEAAAQKLREESLSIRIDKYNFDNAILEYEWAKRAYTEGTFDYKIAVTDYNIAEKTYATAQNQLLSDSYRFIANLHLAEAQYLSALKNKELSEKVYSLTELKYVNGLATQTDMLGAAAQVSEVDAALIGALLNYNMYLNAFEADYILLID